MLIVFRFLQAAGSSSTISIGKLCQGSTLVQRLVANFLQGAGVIADIAPADERGGFIGTFAGSQLLHTTSNRFIY